MKSEDLAALIGEFYNGVLAPDGWVESLKKLALLTSSEAASVVLWNRYSNAAVVGEHVGLPEQLLLDYQDHFNFDDPGRFFLDTMPLGEWYMDERDFGAANIRRSVFYQDFLQHYDLASTMATPIMRANGIDGFLSLSGNPGRRDMVRIAKQLSGLLPHIARAADLRMHLLGATQQIELSTNVLDQLNFPLLIVGYDKKVMLANQLGQQWLSRSANPLSMDSSYSEKVNGMLKTAIGLNGLRRAASMAIRKSSGAVYFLIAVPLPIVMASKWHNSVPLALLWINDPEQSTPLGGDLLRQVFGLSPAEIRLIGPLLNGATLKQAVLQLNLSLETGRSHLKSVFTKLGIRRQSEMHRLLGRFDLLKFKK